MRRLLPAFLLSLLTGTVLAAPPTVPAELDALGLHLTLDADARALVQAKVNSLCRHPAALQARVALAEAAFPLIDQVLAQESVPADFRYLPLQESALQGNAESAHGAVGYWQLKRETALSLGLLVNGSVDERRHLTASTRAAARYLARNNATLHNWLNALLSYNLGLGGARAVVRPAEAGAGDLALTAATSPYVLAFLAQKIVFEPAVAAAEVPFVPWQEVPAAPGQSLAQQAAARAADPAELARLNPWLLAVAVPADGHRYTLLLPRSGPADAVATLPTTAAFLKINGLKALLAQPGETAVTLAERGGASLDFFEKINELAPGEALRPGEPYFFQRKKETADEEYYVVQPGQSLAAVAGHFGVLQRALRTYNHLPADGDARAPLTPGLVLWLSHARPRRLDPQVQPVAQTGPPQPAPTRTPASAPASAAATPAANAPDDELADPGNLPTELPGPPVADLPTRPTALPTGPAAARPAPAVAPVAVATLPAPATTHRVAPGETLYALARQAGTTPAELAAWNGLSPTTSLHVGQVLRLLPPAGAASPAAVVAPAADTATYTVAPGDTLYGIARRYNCTVAQLLAHNGKDAPTLRVGETLRVPRR